MLPGTASAVQTDLSEQLAYVTGWLSTDGVLCLDGACDEGKNKQRGLSVISALGNQPFHRHIPG